MPNKHFYFAMGASLATCAVIAVRAKRHALYQRSPLVRQLYRWDRDWFLYFPFFIALAGGYGLIPDLLHAIGLLPKATTRGPIFDIFLLHSSFERWEDLYPRLDWALNTLASLALGLIALGSLVFYVREVRRIEQARTEPASAAEQ